MTCCGNTAGGELPLTVFPFILRGISLVGIDSQHCPMERRKAVWEHLAGDWKFDHLDDLYTETDLEGLDPYIDRILKGEITGRTLIKVAAG